MKHKYIIFLTSIVLFFSGCNSDYNSNNSETADSSSYPSLDSDYVNISLPTVLNLGYPEINDEYKDVKLPVVVKLDI